MSTLYVAPPGGTITTGRVGNNLTAAVDDIRRPWETPQDAIDASQDGDTIAVFQGVYGQALHIVDKSLSIIGLGRVQLSGSITVEATTNPISLRLTTLLIYPRYQLTPGIATIHLKSPYVVSDPPNKAGRHKVNLYCRNCIFQADHAGTGWHRRLTYSEGVADGSVVNFEYCSVFDYGYKNYPDTSNYDRAFDSFPGDITDCRLTITDSFFGGRNYIIGYHTKGASGPFDSELVHIAVDYGVLQSPPFSIECQASYTVVNTERSFVSDRTTSTIGLTPCASPFTEPLPMWDPFDDSIYIGSFHYFFNPSTMAGNDARVRFSNTSTPLIGGAEFGGVIGGWNNGHTIVEAPVRPLPDDFFGSVGVVGGGTSGTEPNGSILDGPWEAMFDLARKRIPWNFLGDDKGEERVPTDPQALDQKDFKATEILNGNEHLTVAPNHPIALATFPGADTEVPAPRYVSANVNFSDKEAGTRSGSSSGDGQFRVARLLDPINCPIHAGIIIQACKHHTTTGGNMPVTYKGAAVVCALHGRNSIVTGCRNETVRHQDDKHGADSLAATHKCSCACGACVIAMSENTTAEGNSY